MENVDGLEQIWNSKYLYNTSLPSRPLVNDRKASYSSQSLLKALKEIKNNMQFRLGEGNYSFWYDD